MRRGEPLEGLAFYQELYADSEFWETLGKAILAAGRLEGELAIYISNHAKDENTFKANLGRLIRQAEKLTLLEKMVPHLHDINGQRNEFAHNVYALFTGAVEETLLRRSNLLDSDINTYTEYAYQLLDNLNGLAEIVEKYNENI